MIREKRDRARRDTRRESPQIKQPCFCAISSTGELTQQRVRSKMCCMTSIPMKEIRIPSALMREKRSSVLFTFVQATFIALLVAVISFFVLNLLAIVALGITAAIRHRMLDFSVAYREFAAPSAIGVFVLAWTASLVFFFRERSR